MLHKWLGNPAPWHGHYYCALALFLSGLLQISLMRFAHQDSTAGASICTIAVFAYLVKTHQSVTAMINAGFLFVWGCRVIIRGIPAPPETFLSPSTCEVLTSKAIWTWMLSAPTVFAVAMDLSELPERVSTLGVTLCLFAIGTDLLEKNTTQGKFCRNPYAFCSISMCWGLFFLHPTSWTISFPLIFTYIVLFAPGGYRTAEMSRRSRMLKDPLLMEYVRTTSPFIPLPAGVYERLPKCAELFK
jgi:hypothetical protein